MSLGLRSSERKTTGKSLWCGLVVSMAAMWGCSPGEVDGVTTFKLGHGLDTDHPVHDGMERMAELVYEKSDGEMRVDIYPNEQLGTERETLELLQIGSLDFTKVSSAVMESFTPIYQVFGIPFLFHDDEHRFEVLDGSIGQEILEASEPYRIIGLAYYDAGMRSFYTNDRPIEHPDDLQGMRIRVQESPMAMALVRTLGGSPTPISWGELYTALQQGVVGGAENNPPSYESSRHYEVTEYFSLNEHAAPPDIFMISQHRWELLSEDEQEIIREASLESVEYQREVWEEATEKALETVQEAGVEVLYPDKEPFMEASEPFYQQLEQMQPELYELMREIQDVGDELAEYDE